VKQETRHWHEEGFTSPGRSKEQAEDYRYFPEPDLVPIAPSPEWVEELRATLPEEPRLRARRLQSEWGFTDLEWRDVQGAGALDLVDATVAAGATPAAARKWWLTELVRHANEHGLELDAVPMTPAQVAEVQRLVDTGALTDKLARQVVEGVLAGEGEPAEVVARRGLAVVSDAGALRAAVDRAIVARPDAAQRVREGKVQAVGALIGAVMQEMKGQADAAQVRELVLAALT
ncbi:MAG: Asp-tRNA(Asn)/Glu-tRNA(Gln) amidotransferase GatCAB subunit B, partial [Propionibacteriaceae bacterium]|nr:Asp-tRNA(Asn)/Glu-tRNA(Gln) amidotransferase GatCAB subunit B [Propionibacteriaceae bacterium]